MIDYQEFDEATKKRLQASDRLLNYKPNNDKILAFHKSNSKTRLLLGGKRSGKTSSSIVEACWAALGVHPFIDYPPPPVKIRICSVNIGTGKQVILPMLYDWLPRQAIRKFWAEDKILELTNGTLIDIKSYDQDVEAFEGVERHLVVMDEEPPLNIYQSNMLRTISKDINGKLVIACTPLHGIYFNEETEILSEKGWVSYDEICLGDKALTLNCNSGLLEWKPIDTTYCDFQYDGPMISMQGKGFNALVTPDHKWPVVDKDKNSKFKFVLTKDLKTRHKISRNAPYLNLNKEKTYDDDVVKLIGWVITEGTLRHNRHEVKVYQSYFAHPKYCDEIRDIFRSVFGDTGFDEKKYAYPIKTNSLGIKVEYPNRYVAYFVARGPKADFIKSLIPDKQLTPQFLLSLTDEQLKILYDTIMKGDGHIGKYTDHFTQRKSKNLEMFQMLCVLVGLRSTLCSNGWIRGTEYFRVYVSSKKRKNACTYPNSLRREEVNHRGVVWCVHTPNETLVARRNGTIYITGNSWVYSNLYDNPEAVPPYVEHWHMSIYENPHLDATAIDAVLKDPAMKDNIEAAIYGKFFAHSGLVYPMFNTDRHVIKPLEGGKIPDDWLVVLGIDPHDRNPHGVVICGYTKDSNWIVFDEVVQGGTIDELVKTLKAKLGKRFPPNLAIIDTSANAPQSLTGRSVREELTQRHGIYLFDAHKDVTAGRLLVSELLDQGKDANGKPLLPKLYVTENCHNLIRQFRTYMWDNWASRRGEKQDPKEKPMKKDDHLVDAIRYVVMSGIHYRPPGLTIKPKIPGNISPVTGYF